MRLGKPNLFFGVTAGKYGLDDQPATPLTVLRHDDAYTPDNVPANALTAPRWSPYPAL